jgi:peptidylprolyl isomerase
MSVQDKTAAGKRRAQALSGVLAGVAVIAVLVAVFIGIQVSDDDDKTTPAAAAPAASQPAAEPAPVPSEPAAEPSRPAPVQPSLAAALQKKPVVKAGKGDVTKLVVTELVKGTGPELQPGQTLAANYVGVTYADGKEFESTWESGQPAQFPVGTGNLIPGWDKGLPGVKLGSRVQLDIPADMAYGEKPSGGRPGGDLRFVIDLLAAQ